MRKFTLTFTPQKRELYNPLRKESISELRRKHSEALQKHFGIKQPINPLKEGR